ncbi:MAG TPA: hypothetical protein VMZ91_12240 [Candidatus Paceibacterota bacterium]|nr:hypothetical protein [Candidatus Paceibacterota bacterium]
MRTKKTKIEIICDVCGKEEILEEITSPSVGKTRSIQQPIIEMNSTIDGKNIITQLNFRSDTVSDICDECSTELIKAFISQIQKSIL